MVRLTAHAVSPLRASLLVIPICFWLSGCGGDVTQPPPPAKFQIQMVSVNNAGIRGNSFSGYPSISATGRYVVFVSGSANLGAPGTSQVFLRDTCIGAGNCTPKTSLVSVMNDGSIAGDSGIAAISSDGRFVAFVSALPGSTTTSVFLRDTCAGASNCTPSTQLISVGLNTSNPAVSQDGRYVAFQSAAASLGVPANTTQIFVRDTCLGAQHCIPSTQMVSVGPDGSPGNNLSGFYPISMTPDGRFVMFASGSNNLVPGQVGIQADVFVRDTCAGASFCTPSTFRASVANDGSQANSNTYRGVISGNGRFVVFSSSATNLDPSKPVGGIFLRDTCLQTTSCTPSTTLIATTTPNVPLVDAPAISSDGRFVAYIGSDVAYPPQQAFMLDMCRGVAGCTPSTRLISVAADGTPNNGSLSNFFDEPIPLAVSSDGRAIAFTTWANNLVPSTQGQQQGDVGDQVYVAPNPFN